MLYSRPPHNYSASVLRAAAGLSDRKSRCGGCVPAARGGTSMNACVHRLVLSAAVATTLTGVSLLAQGQGHKPPATFRSSVDLVSIQASVSDKRGRPVRGLTTADFEVRDNGQPRPDPVAALRPPVAGEPRDPRRHERQHARRPEDRDGAPGVRLDRCRSCTRARTKSRSSRSTRRSTSARPSRRDLRRLTARWTTSSRSARTSLYDATAATARRLADAPRPTRRSSS